ncbi:MAG TPA: methyltransferase domain-containing protein [Chitinophagaceae bacterium]|nr:methyltransferase domain-containing protein [Chitinophagaceae bacterium]
MPWNPAVYNQFKEERFAPFYDLLALIKVQPGLSVIDLGCGTGELTRKLAEALPRSIVTGVDSSAQMLEESAKYTRPGMEFIRQDIEETIEGDKKWDVVFSNAALQWIEGHKSLFPAAISLVKPGGQFAVQIPSNHDHATHRLIRSIAASEPFKTALGGWNRQSPVLHMEEYAQILFEQGGRNITIFEKAYPHVLADASALSCWTQGTALVPYMERLPEELKSKFLQEYETQVKNIFPGAPIFYPFKRILMYAVF